MKKWGVFLVAVAILGTAGSARAAGIGIGAFGGASIPILQDDNGQGTLMGVRVPVSLIPMLTVEPYYAKVTGGDKDQEVGGVTYTRSGIDMTTFGANAMLTFGTGFQMYPYAGIGTAKAERSGFDASSTAYNFGLGFGFKPPAIPLSVHLRGELAAVLDEDTSETARKWANVTVGVSYSLFNFPPVP